MPDAPAAKGHATKKKAPKSAPKTPAVGALTVSLVAGSVLDDGKVPVAPGQAFRITLLSTSDMAKRRWKKAATAPYSVTFPRIPTGRYVVVAQNLSDVPAYPGAVAEVRVGAPPPAKKGAPPPAPTALEIKLSTDTIGTLARALGFRIGARENPPERGGPGLGDHFTRHFNARIVTAFWSASSVCRAAKELLGAGGNPAVLPGPEATPLFRTNWDGIPTEPNFGSPSLATWLPYNAPGSVPNNMVFVRDANGMPWTSGGRPIHGLLQAEHDGNGPGIPYGPDNRLQITFVRIAEGGDESTLEIVPPEECPKGSELRYFRYHPTLDAAQYTALVWYNANGRPPPLVAAKNLKGKPLIDAMASYVADTIHVRSHLPDASRQYVVVNEPLISGMEAPTLETGAAGQRITKPLLALAKKASARKIAAKIKAARLPVPLVGAWLAQNKGTHWNTATGKTIQYILRAFQAAAAADPGALLLLNEHTAESIETAKGMALALLHRTLQRRLKGSAAGRVAVGFQMHISDRYYPKEKRTAFLRGLGKSLDYYTRFAKSRVLVTEMGVRPPGLAAADRGFYRLSYACALARVLAVVQDPAYFPAPPAPPPPPAQPPASVTVTAHDPLFGPVTKVIEAAGPTRIDGHFPLKTKAPGAKRASPDPVRFAVMGGALWIAGKRAGASTAELHKWVKAHEKQAKALFKLLGTDKAGRFTQLGAWPDFMPALDALAAAVKTSPAERREQADLVYKVARTCLSRERCDDLSFWGLLDSFHNDKYDWRGFLFTTEPAHGSKPPDEPDFPFYRKASYMGAVQAIIEAAIAKKRTKINAYAASHGRTAASTGDHAYEQHLFPGV
ncbi:MAG: endo-1,4-beta-xylanase [Polyangiaceae bacterium]